jgi:hypothetical protein
MENPADGVLSTGYQFARTAGQLWRVACLSRTAAKTADRRTSARKHFQNDLSLGRSVPTGALFYDAHRLTVTVATRRLVVWVAPPQARPHAK